MEQVVEELPGQCIEARFEQVVLELEEVTGGELIPSNMFQVELVLIKLGLTV